jgi:hypothetical protein
VLPDAEARGEVIDWSFFHLRVAPDGTLADLEQAYANTKGRINTHEHAAFSSLLRKPLAAERGGAPHLGGAQFATERADDYRALFEWIEREHHGAEGRPRDTLPPLQQQFARDVLPVLASRQCLNGPCHGGAAPFTHFEPPVVVNGEPRFSSEAVESNYHAARMHLFLGGDPSLSRLVRKVLPLARGGIAHRGGNDIFFPSGRDAALEGVLAWARAEQAAELSSVGHSDAGHNGAEAGMLRAVVMVRGPAAAGAPFDHQEFVPGTDLFILEPPTADGVLRNLSAALHPEGPVDVRDPTVSHDATRVAFAMRRSAADSFDLYEVELAGGQLRQLTSDAKAHDVQPSYGPDGRLFFVSTRAGVLADGHDVTGSDLWAVHPDSGALERLSHDPSPIAAPSFIGVGKSYGTLAYTVRRTIGGRYHAPVLRMPLDHNRAWHGDPELHIHHGITAPEDVVYAMRTTPDGRFSCVLLGRDNRWRGGRLALFDRQLGPEISEGSESLAAVGGFRHAYSILSDDQVAASGPSPGGFFRHPVPLPDGRLLVSWSGESLDLNDASASPDLGLYLVTLDESGEGGRPRIASFDRLLDDPSVAEYDAEPVVVRPREDGDHEPGWDAARESQRATVAFRHVETLEALLTNLSQAGAKRLRDDLAFLRLVEPLPVTAEQHATAPAGLGIHGRSRILAEVPLRGGSVLLDVPSDTPFRVQYLNADRMAVGAQHNRYNHAAPGETFPGGVSPELYPTLCAGCHGSLSGDPSLTGGPIPDIITAASLTQATHEAMNPRRPRTPDRVGEAPIGVDFARDIAPLLQRSCAISGCHRAPEAAGGLDLESRPGTSFDPAFDQAYEQLLQPGPGSAGGQRYVDERGSSAFGSYLIERIYQRELGAPRELDGGCPGEPPLSDAERLSFVRWVDLGATYRGTAP